MYIYPYNPKSESAKTLSNALDIRRIKHHNSRFKGAPHKLVINWGSSQVPAEVAKCQILNAPGNVANAANKLESFIILRDAGVSIPNFTQDVDEVVDHVSEGQTWIARTILNGHSGQGIVFIEDLTDLVDALLYVEYVPKKQEYRIHVAGGEVISIQRKARNKDVPDDQVNWRVRNLVGGFIFARQDVNPPVCVLEESIKAVGALNLHFGAVDVIYNEKQERAYVLEVNTAPGLTGTTVDDYVRYFSSI